METIRFRIRMPDYKIIRQMFKGYEGETAAEYFHRLRLWLESIRK